MTTNPPNPSREDLDWLTVETGREQDYYWTRFSAFATLHAGLLVVVASDIVKRPYVMAIVATAIGAIWLYVQWASRFYVDRLKPHFHAARTAHGFTFKRHWLFSRTYLSSTDVALIVPAGLTVFWILFPSFL